MVKEINDKVFDRFPVLESERLLFRAFELGDAPGFFSLRSDKRVMQFMDSVWHRSLSDSEAKIKEILEDFKAKKGINWVIVEKNTNKFAGYFCFWKLDRHNRRAEIGYSLLPEYWGKGYMTETLQLLLNFGFQEMAIHGMEANVNSKNVASIKLLLKLGFQKEAHFRENYFFEGKFLDSEIFCLLTSDWNK